MRIAGVYSFNGGKEEVARLYPDLLTEVNEVIKLVDSSTCKTKESTERTMIGQMLYSPKDLNKAFKREFDSRDWKAIRVSCTYATTHYLEDYTARELNAGAFRDMDFVKKISASKSSSESMLLWYTMSVPR